MDGYKALVVVFSAIGILYFFFCLGCMVAGILFHGKKAILSIYKDLISLTLFLLRNKLNIVKILISIVFCFLIFFGFVFLVDTISSLSLTGLLWIIIVLLILKK